MYYMDAQDRENKAAVMLAKARYDAQLKPWVKDSAARFAYVSKEVDRIIDECVAETGADHGYVKSRLDSILAEAVKDNSDTPPKAPKDVKAEGNDDVHNEGEVKGMGLEDSLKGIKTEKLAADDDKYGTCVHCGHKNPLPFNDAEHCDKCGKNPTKQGGVETVKENLESFLDGKAEAEDEESAEDEEEKTSSLSDESTWKPCFRCGTGLNPVVAAISPVCKKCTDQLTGKEAATFEDESEGNPENTNDSWSPQDEDAGGDPTQLFQCSICAKQGIQFDGSREEVLTHLQNEHPELDEQTTADDGQTPPKYDVASPVSSVKISDVPGDVSHGEIPPVDVAPQQQNPADRFDNIVQETADRAAARQLSLPSDNEVAEIASATELQDTEVRQKLIGTATFGNFSATNGSIEDQQLPDGYTEVTVGTTGGRIDNHQALVPVDVVVNKVAEEMGMERELVLTQVTDRYGGGALPDKYHASVSGERHFYLPSEIAGPAAAPAPPQPDPAQGLPAEGTPPVPPEDPNADPNRPFSKVAEIIAEEKRNALARRQRLAIS